MLNCTVYNEAELKSDLDQAIGEKYDIILDEDVLSESYGNQLLDILKDINDKNGHDIFLVIVAEFTGNLDSSAQSYAKSYCSSIEKCVFIIYDNSKKKIGSYFGKKTELNSLEMNSKFDNYYTSNKDIYLSLKELLTTIKDTIKSDSSANNNYFYIIFAVAIVIFLAAGIYVYIKRKKQRKAIMDDPELMGQQQMYQQQNMNQPQMVSQQQNTKQPQTMKQPQMVSQPQNMNQQQMMNQPQMMNQQQPNSGPYVSAGFGSNNDNF